jgi:hypothetical protein
MCLTHAYSLFFLSSSSFLRWRGERVRWKGWMEGETRGRGLQSFEILLR